MLDDKGWYLALWGSITWRGVDMARVWKYMNENGMPAYMGDAERMASALRGDDYVLIVPSHESVDYVRGEYFGHDIVTAIHLPEENRAAILEHIEWQPLKTAQLIER